MLKKNKVFSISLIEKTVENGKILYLEKTKRKTFIYKRFYFLDKFCKKVKSFDKAKYIQILCNNNFYYLYTSDLKNQTTYFYKKVIPLNKNFKPIKSIVEEPKYLKTKNIFNDFHLYTLKLKEETYFFKSFKLLDKNLKRIGKDSESIKYIELKHNNTSYILYSPNLKFNSDIYSKRKKLDKNFKNLKKNNKLCYIEIENNNQKQLYTSSLKSFSNWYTHFKVIEKNKKIIVLTYNLKTINYFNSLLEKIT